MRLQCEGKIIHHAKLRGGLLPRLRGNVFHVTSREGLSGIKATGAILANQDGTLGDSFSQSQKSYFRSKGCVCLFDLRNVSDHELDIGLETFFFLNPDHVDDNPVFLFLREQHLGKLRPWSEAGSKMVVPYVESGFPDKVPIDMVQAILCVRVVGTHENADFEESVVLAWSEKSTRPNNPIQRAGAGHGYGFDSQYAEHSITHTMCPVSRAGSGA